MQQLAEAAIQAQHEHELQVGEAEAENALKYSKLAAECATEAKVVAAEHEFELQVENIFSGVALGLPWKCPERLRPAPQPGTRDVTLARPDRLHLGPRLSLPCPLRPRVRLRRTRSGRC